MASVEIINVDKVYDNGFQALHGLNLTIADGEFLVLVGPSGCGKSTALRCIAGLESVSAGDIRLNGRSVVAEPSSRRDMAMVFQNYALYPHMTVAQNMGFSLKLSKVSKPEIAARVEEAAVRLELCEVLGNKPAQLSGGQRQRVAMGRAIVRRPQVFLMDEPLSNLDAKLRVKTRTEIAALQRDLGVTTLYVTHDQVEAMTMADRVAVLRDGVLNQVAAPRDLYRNPVNAFVAAFIGSPAMNLFQGRVNERTISLGASAEIPLRPELRGRFALPPDSKIVVGIRPEDITVSAGIANRERFCPVPATVRLVESLGAELQAHLEIDAHEVDSGDPDSEGETRTVTGSCVARLAEETSIMAGDRIEVAFDTDKLHLFHAESHETLRQQTPSPAQ